MKIKLFTHTDLDGIGCYILAREVLGENNVDVEYCDYDNIDEKVGLWLTGPDRDNYDMVFITDISVGEHVALMLDELNDENDGYVRLLDHHKTALHLNQYRWATVIVNHSEDKIASGTSLLERWFNQHDYPIEDNVRYFVGDVRRYDTWEWHDKYNDLEAKQLNDLLSIYGREEFIQDIHDKLTLKDDLIGDADKRILEIRQKEIDRYINKKAKNVRVIDHGDYRFGVVFSEQYSSEMGNVLSTKLPELDFIMMINVDTMSASLRTIHDAVDVGAFAKQFGGGGHRKAAGMPLNQKLKDVILALHF